MHQEYTNPLGSEIVSVNEIATQEFLEQNFGSRLGNRTPFVRENMLAEHLTIDTQRSVMILEAVTPENETILETITFKPLSEELLDIISEMDNRAHLDLENVIQLERGAFAQVHDHNIHHISLQTFGNLAIPEAVRQYIEDVADTAKGFIIDIRGSGGGTSDMVILSQFADPREFNVVTAHICRLGMLLE